MVVSSIPQSAIPPHISPISYTRSYNPLLRSEAVQPEITVIGAGTKVENGGDINESRKDNKVEDSE